MPQSLPRDSSGRAVDTARTEQEEDKGNEAEWPTTFEANLKTDTGHKALCPVSLPRTRAYYGRVPGILWGKGHTMVDSGTGIL
eukprot:COSAG02_NODE_1272_length_13523_cov_3.824866_17_plen_83_part_00